MIRPPVINAPVLDATTARGDWTGKTERARFEGAANSDKARAARRFGKKG